MGITTNTVRSRVERLQKNGVLQIIGLVDPTAIPGHSSAFIGFKVETSKIKQVYDRIKNLKGVVIAALVSGKFDIWLLVLGITLPQIGVIMAADFFLFRKEKYRFETIPNIPNYRWEAWLAWLLGTIAACLTHFKIFELTQVPALDGMSVAFLIYILTMLKSSPQKTHQGDFGY